STRAELANQEGFSQAVRYAKKVWASQPDLKERYIAAGKLIGRQGFHLAKSDFRRPPKVVDLDLSDYTGAAGEEIKIMAEDDFEVKEVKLVIRKVGGAVIEEGAAVKGDETWTYRSKNQVSSGQTVAIEVTAVDYPGHTGTKRVDHACG